MANLSPLVPKVEWIAFEGRLGDTAKLISAGELHLLDERNGDLALIETTTKDKGVHRD
jgi:hypothetical protein